MFWDVLHLHEASLKRIALDSGRQVGVLIRGRAGMIIPVCGSYKLDTHTQGLATLIIPGRKTGVVLWVY